MFGWRHSCSTKSQRQISNTNNKPVHEHFDNFVSLWAWAPWKLVKIVSGRELIQITEVETRNKENWGWKKAARLLDYVEREKAVWQLNSVELLQRFAGCCEQNGGFRAGHPDGFHKSIQIVKVESFGRNLAAPAGRCHSTWGRKSSWNFTVALWFAIKLLSQSQPRSIAWFQLRAGRFCRFTDRGGSGSFFSLASTFLLGFHHFFKTKIRSCLVGMFGRLLHFLWTCQKHPAGAQMALPLLSWAPQVNVVNLLPSSTESTFSVWNSCDILWSK